MINWKLVEDVACPVDDIRETDAWFRWGGRRVNKPSNTAFCVTFSCNTASHSLVTHHSRPASHSLVSSREGFRERTQNWGCLNHTVTTTMGVEDISGGKYGWHRSRELREGMCNSVVSISPCQCTKHIQSGSLNPIPRLVRAC